MNTSFFEKPILNSPYDYPARHWELDKGIPTNKLIDKRRPVALITAIPKPKKRRRDEQREMVLGEGKGLSTEEQERCGT